ncbi:MAG: hypothetical protein ABI680_07340, partial [Chthoniobacteraceae bacterium]
PSAAPLAQPWIRPLVARLPIVLLDEGFWSGNGQEADADLSEDSAAAAKELRDRLADQFVADIGGPGQNPNDPEYAQRWLDTVEQNNRNFRAFYGKQAYLKKDISSAQEAIRY